MEVIDLLTVRGPLINMLHRVRLGALLHRGVVPTALLLVLGALLINFTYVLGALVAQGMRFYWV